MGAERVERNAEQAGTLLMVMYLAELRGALDFTQEELAERLSAVFPDGVVEINQFLAGQS